MLSTWRRNLPGATGFQSQTLSMIGMKQWNHISVYFYEVREFIFSQSFEKIFRSEKEILLNINELSKCVQTYNVNNVDEFSILWPITSLWLCLLVCKIYFY